MIAIIAALGEDEETMADGADELEQDRTKI